MTEREVPIGINTAGGAVTVVAAASLAGALAPAAGWERTGVLALALAGFGITVADPLATLVVAAIAALIVDGFLVNQYGVLSWHGQADLRRLLTLAGAAAAGSAIGVLRARLRHRRRYRAIEDWANSTAGIDEVTATTPISGPIPKATPVLDPPPTPTLAPTAPAPAPAPTATLPLSRAR